MIAWGCVVGASRNRRGVAPTYRHRAVTSAEPCRRLLCRCATMGSDSRILLFTLGHMRDRILLGSPWNASCLTLFTRATSRQVDHEGMSREA